MLEFLASLDVSGKIDALVRGAWFTARGRGAARVTFAPPVGSSPADCESYLFRRGVAVFGRGFEPGRYDAGDGLRLRVAYVHCSAKQRRWAEYILARAGAIILDPADLASLQAAEAHGGGLPPAWADGSAQRDPARAAEVQAKPGPARRKPSRAARALRDLW